MIRKIAMAALMVGALGLSACDWCCGSESEAAGGAAMKAGESCGECLEGCDEGGLAADVAGDAAPAAAMGACPVSGKGGGDCSGAATMDCGMKKDCSGAQCDDKPASCDEACKDACETPCEKPAMPQGPQD